jgi:hypothetical protein
MPDWLYDAGENGLWVFAVVTIAIGGGAAWATGKALAETWRPFWQLPLYVLLLTSAVRFLHMALFDELMVSARNFAVDALVIGALAYAGHRMARARTMARQYPWLADVTGEDRPQL